MPTGWPTAWPSMGHAVASLHGGMPQGRRNRVLQGLRSKHLRVLVATDVAARGIDVPTISHVINYGLPMKAEDYVHRIGRTGRAGRNGLAVTLAERMDAGMIRRIQHFTTQDIPVATVAGLEPQQPRAAHVRAAPCRCSAGARPLRRQAAWRPGLRRQAVRRQAFRGPRRARRCVRAARSIGRPASAAPMTAALRAAGSASRTAADVRAASSADHAFGASRLTMGPRNAGPVVHPGSVLRSGISRAHRDLVLDRLHALDLAGDGLGRRASRSLLLAKPDSITVPFSVSTLMAAAST